MRSGTSYFNSTLFAKAVTRFWPLWSLYTFIWAMIFPLRMLSEALNRNRWETEGMLMEHLRELAQSIPTALSNFGIALAVTFGVACAMAMFGYLYTTRSACMMHAMPVRREGLFLTHYLAGLSFLLVPHLIVFVLTASIELALGCFLLEPLTQWLLLQSGVCLFFYSFSAFCAMFTGNLMALPVFYGILNVLAVSVASLIQIICGFFWYGYEGASGPVWDAVEWLTPVAKLENALQYQWTEEGMLLLNQPSVIGIYVAVGLVLTAAALQVYRIRHMESAGDVVAINMVRPLFKYGVAVCTGLTGGIGMYMLLYMGSGTLLIAAIVLWSVVGYFIGEMILKKSFRVLKAWKGAVAVAGAMTLLCLSISMDWFGYERYTPEVDQVSQVIFRVDSAPDDGGSRYLEIEDPEHISQVIEIHRQILERGDRQNEPYEDQYERNYIWLEYTLNNGRKIARSYHSVPVYEEQLQQEGSLEQIAQGLLDQRDLVEQMYSIPDLEEWRITDAYLTMVWDAETQSYGDALIETGHEKLWEAMQQDFAEGNLGKRYLLESSDERRENTYLSDIHFELADTERREEQESGWISWRITLTPQATHTLTLLREMGVLDETHQLMTHTEADRMEDMGEEIPDTEVPGAATTEVVGYEVWDIKG